MSISHADFMRAIRSDPDNNIHWYVYADWCEEQGDNRSDLLRLVPSVREFNRGEVYCEPLIVDGVSVPVQKYVDAVYRSMIGGTNPFEWYELLEIPDLDSHHKYLLWWTWQPFGIGIDQTDFGIAVAEGAGDLELAALLRQEQFEPALVD